MESRRMVFLQWVSSVGLVLSIAQPGFAVVEQASTNPVVVLQAGTGNSPVSGAYINACPSDYDLYDVDSSMHKNSSAQNYSSGAGSNAVAGKICLKNSGSSWHCPSGPRGVTGERRSQNGKDDCIYRAPPARAEDTVTWEGYCSLNSSSGGAEAIRVVDKSGNDDYCMKSVKPLYLQCLGTGSQLVVAEFGVPTVPSNKRVNGFTCVSYGLPTSGPSN